VSYEELYSFWRNREWQKREDDDNNNESLVRDERKKVYFFTNDFLHLNLDARRSEKSATMMHLLDALSDKNTESRRRENDGEDCSHILRK